jgi:hypothetical protein
MKILVKILKIAGLVFLAIAILIGSFFGYDSYKHSQRKKAELNFDNDKQKWKWHGKSQRIQISTLNDSGKSVLRKVFLKEKYIVYAYKNDDYSIAAMVKFFTDCQPNTEITTTQKFSDGTPKKLKCTESGDALYFYTVWDTKDTNFDWEENLDGFKLRVSFGYWDFTKLDKEITLTKAKLKRDEVPIDETSDSKQIEPEQKGRFVIEQHTPEEKEAINMVKYSKVLGYLNVETTIRNWLKEIKGNLEIIGWKGAKISEQTYLVSYTYDDGSGVKGYYFDVNLKGKIVRKVTGDHELEEKYGIINVPRKKVSLKNAPPKLENIYSDLSIFQGQSLPNIVIREKKDWGFCGYGAINHSYEKKSINGDEVVIDHTTGLMWHQSGSSNQMHWYKTQNWIDNLNNRGYADFIDWRLPSLDEVAALLEPDKKNTLYIDDIFHDEQSGIWSGNRYGSEGAWSVLFRFAYVTWDEVDTLNYVRPVRTMK